MNEDYLDTIYKYTDSDGAGKILSKCTLRFSRPSKMNDPFDVYIDDLFGMDIKEFVEESGKALFDVIKDNPQLMSSACNINLNEVMPVSNLLNSLPEKELLDFKERIGTIDLAEFNSTFKDIQMNLKTHRDEFANSFKTYAIFCATKTPKNLLMWAHYAEQHKGAVLGFKADIEKDSFLRLMRPVIYCDERPFIIDGAKKSLNGHLQNNNMARAKEAAEKLLHTKSSQWKYEEEVRLAIPRERNEGESSSDLKFYPSELKELYLGVRMDSSNKERMISLAKSLNPNVAIYDSKLSKRQYGLEFDSI